MVTFEQMANRPHPKRATYDDVLRAPPEMTAEVLDGELHLMPRPRRSQNHRCHERTPVG